MAHRVPHQRSLLLSRQELFSDVEQHNQFVDVKNHQHQQLRASLSELVDPTELQNKMNSLNNQSKQVREGAELHLSNLDECQELLKSYEENFSALKGFMTDLNDDKVTLIVVIIIVGDFYY